MTTAISLETLGFTKDELADRVVAKLVDQLLNTYVPVVEEDTGAEYEDARPTKFAALVTKAVHDRIDAAVQTIADQHLAEKTPDFIGSVVFQPTNAYGEKKADPMTFREYLVHRAETYMTEKVDYEGKAKGEGYGSWEGRQTRISHMVNKYLHWEIERAMKNALAAANSQIVGGLEQTCKIQLALIAEKLKVKVEVP